MKTHTYFLSEKALAIVSGALAASGALVFAVGVGVGLMIQEPMQRAAGGASGTATPTSAPIASTDDTPASPAADSPSAWPFSMPGASEPAPAAGDTGSAPADTTPAKAKGDTAVHRRAVTDAAFVGPSARRMTPDDLTQYAVHVGAFRSERNAHLLIGRLEAAGYRPVETLRMEGGRQLHVVTVGGYVGRRAAIAAAERIGDAEQLVAVAAPARLHR